MKKIFFVYPLLLATVCNAQNVGIGTTTPAYPLSFPNTIGDKISLYGSGGPNYGFGIQGSLFQMYSDAPGANIAFGHGSSNSFIERMRLYNNGSEGLLLNGRITLRNGTLPLNTAYGPGIWFNKADNSGNLAFFGTQNNQNIGFVGGPAGWGFVYDAVNSRVGIGNVTPNAPLSFGATLGRKITLYPGTIGSAGIGVYANELRIHSDYPNADITFGHENTGGTFTERMRFRGNGAVNINGNAGTPGDVMQSNGNNAPVTWGSASSQLYNGMYQFDLPESHTLGGVWHTPHFFTNLTQTINLAKTSKVLVSMNWAARSENVIGDVTANFHMNVNSDPPAASVHSKFIRLTPGQSDRGNTGFRMLVLPPGNHTFKISVYNSGALFYYGNDYQGVPVSMNIIVIPQ